MRKYGYFGTFASIIIRPFMLAFMTLKPYDNAIFDKVSQFNFLLSEKYF